MIDHYTTGVWYSISFFCNIKAVFDEFAPLHPDNYEDAKSGGYSVCHLPLEWESPSPTW
jgi:hypothetical protein